MVYAKVKFTLSACPQTALLTARGWTLIQASAAVDQLLNHICPLSDFQCAGDCAARMAQLLKGSVHDLVPDPPATCPPVGLTPDTSSR